MISAVIHTYNEEKNIQRCLSSLRWVDEIVMIDMDSKDRTREIAGEYNVKIFDHPYTGFVEPARNFGIKKAIGSWILIIDADEEVPKTLADTLITLSADKSIDYYRIARRNIIFGKWIKHSGWSPDFQVRFFRKGYISWSDKIHGIPLTKGIGHDLEPTEQLSITHYNYQSLEQYLDRLNRYTSISAKELFISNQHFTFKDIIKFPTSEFIHRYLVWEGYKDGIHGLALALLQSFSEAVIYLKLWELENFKEERISLDEVSKEIENEQKSQRYWFMNTLLIQPHNFINGLFWKVKRKLASYG